MHKTPNTQYSPRVTKGPIPELDSILVSILITALLPVVLGLLLPASILSLLYNWIKSLLKRYFKKSKIRKTSKQWLQTTLSKQDRALDIVLYGATGFTGNLAAHYLAKNYQHQNVKWGLGGRSLKRLQEVRDQLTEINSKFANIELFVADCADAEALRRLAVSTRTVITTAGPYARCGELLLATCVSQGTDYLDITGESQWVTDMNAKYSAQASLTGARLVSQCGFDSVPWDLLTLKLSKSLRIQDPTENLQTVLHINDTGINPSGGTILSLVNMLSDFPSFIRSLKQLTDGNSAVYQLPEDNTKSTFRIINKPSLTLKYDKDFKAYRGLCLTEGGNLPVIARSNALLSYNKQLKYQELSLYTSIWQYYNIISLSSYFLLAISIPPLRYLLQRYVLRQPGHGPSNKWLNSNYLTIKSFAEGSKGSKYETILHYAKDPGYIETARMIVEGALTLKFHAEQLENVPGGFYTPASLFGELYFERLIITGCHFEFLKH